MERVSSLDRGAAAFRAETAFPPAKIMARRNVSRIYDMFLPALLKIIDVLSHKYIKIFFVKDH